MVWKWALQVITRGQVTRHINIFQAAMITRDGHLIFKADLITPDGHLVIVRSIRLGGKAFDVSLGFHFDVSLGFHYEPRRCLISRPRDKAIQRIFSHIVLQSRFDIIE
jgi:hypothetical protein